MIRTAWRIVKRKYAGTAFTGAGSRRAGGRWSSSGRAVVYAAGSPSLALLEILVHVDHTLLPAYVGIPVRIHEELVTRIDPETLPDDWRAFPAPDRLQVLGDRWHGEAATPVLEVPGAVMPLESNYLLNPAHPRFGEIEIGEPRTFAPDLRLLTLERRN